MAKRCLIVSYYFPPVGGAGVQRIVKLIKYLSRREWRFTVICASEDSNLQPQDESLQAELPADLKQISVPFLTGLKQRKKGPISALLNRGSYWKRWLAAFVSIPDIRRKWVEPARKAVLAELQTQQYDCILVTAPPYSLALLAAQLGQDTKVPVILDLRDPWSLHPYKIHPTPWHYLYDRKLELETIARIRFGVSAYDRLLEYYSREIPDFKRKQWTFIANGFDEEDFINLKPEKLPKDVLHIGYSGTIHSEINNPAPLFKMMRRLRDSKSKNKIIFHHVGRSQFDLKKTAQRYGVEDQVVCWGYHPHREALEILNGMHVLLLLHHNRFKNSGYIVAGKVYEYLRLRKPILALVPTAGEAADLIRQTQAGVILEADDKNGLEETLKAWCRQRPQPTSGPIEAFNREKQALQFERVLQAATSGIN